MSTKKSYEQLDAERAAFVQKLKTDMKAAYTANDQEALADLHKQARAIQLILLNNIANLETISEQYEGKNMYGRLARKAGFLLPLSVCSSRAGYYIGTIDNDGFPVSRESVEYFDSWRKADWALTHDKFTQRKEL